MPSKITNSIPYTYVVHPKTNKVIARFSDSEVSFKRAGKLLKKDLEISGISIPASQRVEFRGRSVVYPSDGADFARAFKDFYFPNVLRESGFFLRKMQGDDNHDSDADKLSKSKL